MTAVLTDYLTERGPEIIARDRIVYAVKRLVPFWIGRTVDQVTKENCRLYARGRAAGTVRRELGVLAAAINHAHSEGRLTRKVMVHRPDKPEARDRWLTRSEAARLLRSSLRRSSGFRYLSASACSPYLALFLLLGLYSGRRKEAILSLRWPQVDLVAGTIDFRKPGEAETKKRRGKVAIGRKLLGHLRRAYARHGKEMGYVIHDADGNRIKDIKKGFAGAVRRAGLGPDVTPHVLKHTCATWLFHNGKSIEDAASFLHTSIATLESVYRHSSEDHERQTAEAI